MKKLLASILALMLIASCAAMAETSLTTGLTIDKANKTLVCQVDNEPGARPQVGIASADVIYETEVYNGGYTRYTCVFNDTIPEKVEPVRSARMVHLDIYQDWGGIFSCYGFQFAEGTDARSYAKKVAQVLVNGLNGDPAFYRDSKRSAPNNVIYNMAEKYDSVEEELTVKSPLTFGETPTVQGDGAKFIEVVYRNDYKPSYQWDEEKGVYKRYYNGYAWKDSATDEQLTFSNVIVQRVDYSWYGGASNRPVVAMTGKNTCDYFIGGMHFTGYWERNTLNDNTVYYDDAGNVVQFACGKTFIQIVKDSVEMTYSAIEGSSELVEDREMAKGARGADVTELQMKLVELGFMTGKVDGIFGAGTEKAVMAAQAAFNLDQTGIAGVELLSALFEQDDELVQAIVAPAEPEESDAE